MFCPTCGSNIPDQAVRCKHCGTDTRAWRPRAEGATLVYCRECGSQIAREAEVCVHCGARARSGGLLEALEPRGEGRSWTAAVILCALLFCSGVGGLHRFYTGRVGSGVVQLLTCGGFMIWQIVDLIRLLSGSFRDADDRPLLR